MVPDAQSYRHDQHRFQQTHWQVQDAHADTGEHFLPRMGAFLDQHLPAGLDSDRGDNKRPEQVTERVMDVHEYVQAAW